MSFSSAFMLDVQLQPGRPPMTSVDAGGDTAGWVADHRNALRAVVTEHGSVLVRGLGLRAADQVGVVFRRLAGDLMADREAFASRQASSDGRVFLDQVALEPADVHAPRAELPVGVPGADVVRVSDGAVCGWGDGGG